MLDYSHNPAFVLASLAIALIAAFSGLSLTQGLSKMSETVRKIAVSASAVILGWGIWSMHFVAMLGLDLPIAFFFDPLVTLISALTAILFMGLALLIVHFGQRTRAKIVTAGAVVGIGIPVMHYIGMSGMELCAPVYSAAGVVAALVLSIGLSVLSFLIAYDGRSARNIVLGTLGFGLAVFAVHFIAMAGTGFVPMPEASAILPPMSPGVLAFGVTISAFVLSGIFLLNGASFATRLGGVSAAPAKMAPEDPSRAAVPPAPPTPAAPAPAPDTATEIAPPGAVPAGLRIPYEAEARTHFIAANEVSAVRAEGHYTVLYSGASKLFCPWSITEAEARIPKDRFIRTHRSYLVNLDHVTSFERKKDNGVCFFEGTAALPKVPVSRSRLAEVRDRLGM
ncbi:MHYT domain-containing protein [Tropicibacter oceani]|uniref:MHYT domain-containing protein n=1 Tax=Tropicibacter oceani TaxID=3058420 RepID=A0ABY8QD58_9RHOB|nr:MHYT domain-containing protein [Tropicibacter oceani]WGW02368.1 MHYT domain-containing protein [Tropicibacter oceani]